MVPNKFSAALLTAAALLSITPTSAWAKPTTSGQARAVVQVWRQMETAPLKSSLGKTTGSVQTFRDATGTELYHVVSLDPTGFAIVPADDLVEPIIAFSSEGTFDPSETNPLGALVSRDLPGRIACVRGKTASTLLSYSVSPTTEQTTAQRKWDRLQGTTPALAYGLVILSDVRVAPLIQSQWDQSTVNGNLCYNYYTPYNYVSGCVATALSQLMRFHQFPNSSIGTATFAISVNGGADQYVALMGGDGVGGAYDWSQMTLVPNGATSNTQRQAIGRLLHDTGATVHMDYASDSSGADTFQMATALKNNFGYSSAIKGDNGNQEIPSAARNTMVNPNLDAGLPVLFAIEGSYGGHAVVGDGYGYQSGTMYHHLNMGWSGNSDLWYNLPNVDSSIPFTSVRGVVYNIYASGSGEIVSGRVVDCAGAPASGVTITASLNSAAVLSTTTNNKGIYALKGLSSSKTYTITASKSGFTFAPQTATTGASTDYSSISGNKWGVDFANTTCTSSTLNVTKSGTGSGTVTSSPAGISCGVTCSTSYSSPSSITLTAAADTGSAFIGWSGGGCSGNGVCTVSLVANTTVTANFVSVSQINSEPFSGTSAPTGWTAQDNLGGAGRNWDFGTNPCFDNQTGGSGYSATAESNCNGTLLSVDSSLISPSYNLSQYAGVTLSFRTYIDYWNNSAGDVDVSNDSGANWTNVWRKGPGTNGTHYGPATESVDITPLAAGKDNVKVRFRYYTNNYGSYWEVDDFILNGAVVLGPPTITSAKAGNSQASIYFSPPVPDGGGSITGYTVTSNLGTTPPSSSIPIIVAGLSNGTPYTFTVTAVNSAGPGTSSAPSCSVTPGLLVNKDYDETGYQTIQAAYGGPHNSEIHIQANAPVGGFAKTGSDSIVIVGGYDPAFSANSGALSILSKLTLSGGTTKVQKVVVRSPRGNLFPVHAYSSPAGHSTDGAFDCLIYSGCGVQYEKNTRPSYTED